MIESNGRMKGLRERGTEEVVNQLALNTALLEVCREMEAESAAVINS